ncbi:MAG: hypothetical protein F9K29_23270 [Hyphomicrobiaceae bacterium]|nr:MAG: hypothetical protein F9K29_23270 [Hyphomicrobiaceae bacterium]
MSFSRIVPMAMVALAAALAPAQAAPTGHAFAPGVATAGTGVVTDVHGRRGWRRGPAPWIGLGAGVVLGTIIADHAYRPRPGYFYDDYSYDGPYYYPSDYEGDPREMCARNFRSFEWRTGLYTTYSGEKRLCPYLR